jgi:hypothetical protein
MMLGKSGPATRQRSQVLSQDERGVRGVLTGETKIRPIWADSPSSKKRLKGVIAEDGYG